MLYLQTLYNLLYPNSTILKLSRFYYQSKILTMNKEEFTSSISRSQRSAAVAAHWPGVIGIDPRGEAPLRVGIVKNYFKHDITLIRNPDLNNSPKKVTHIFPRVDWYMDHPRRDFLHSPMMVAANVFNSDSCSFFIHSC